MNLTKSFVLALVCSVLPLSAFAHHDGDPIGELMEEAATLDSVVQSSWIRPNVKYAVSHFVQDISPLDDCSGLSPVADHQGPSCRGEVAHVQMAWRRVGRYLYDTNFDFPQVYNQYLRTQTALQSALAFIGRQ